MSYCLYQNESYRPLVHKNSEKKREVWAGDEKAKQRRDRSTKISRRGWGRAIPGRGISKNKISSKESTWTASWPDPRWSRVMEVLKTRLAWLNRQWGSHCESLRKGVMVSTQWKLTWWLWMEWLKGGRDQMKVGDSRICYNSKTWCQERSCSIGRVNKIWWQILTQEMLKE